MVNPRLINNRLQSHLNKLQTQFDFGYHLKVRYIPKIRWIDDKRILPGESISNCIIIYKSNKDPIYVLNHEFVELMQNSITKEYEKVINYQNQLLIQHNQTILKLNRLLYLQREKYVNKIVQGLNLLAKEKLYE